MSNKSYSTSDVCRSLFKHSLEAYQLTREDSLRSETLDLLANMVAGMEDFVRGYELIDDPEIDTDDEILNWAFSETVTDFCSAIWLLASGFYKASASSLRNAFDISTASLYFQIRENTDPRSGGYNIFFAEWDSGKRQTPNWGEMKPFIESQPSVIKFKSQTGVDILQDAYSHFKYLCAYTHTSAFAKNGSPITAINTTGIAPIFDERFFQRGCDLTYKTISWIAILWQVVFPQIARTPRAAALGESIHKKLFPPPVGPLVLAHR